MRKIKKYIMQNRFISAMFIIIACIGGSINAIFGLDSMFNFLLGYIAFGVIVASSFLNVKKQLKNLHKDREDNSESHVLHTSQNTTDSQEKPIPFTSRFIVGTKMSFSLLRIMGYLGFIGGMLTLAHYDSLKATSLFAGVSIATMYVIGIGVFRLRAQH